MTTLEAAIMGKSRSKKGTRPRVDVNIPELDGILDAGLEKPLTRDGHGKLKSVIHALVSQRGKPDWRSSEKTAEVMAGLLDGESSEPDDDAGTLEGEKKKAPGHGRNGARAYTGARKVQVPHPELTRGEGCPGELCKGKVYPLKDPKPIVRIIGQPMFAATVHELEQMRCNLCGVVYTAQPPRALAPKSTTSRWPAWWPS